MSLQEEDQASSDKEQEDDNLPLICDENWINSQLSDDGEELDEEEGIQIEKKDTINDNIISINYQTPFPLQRGKTLSPDFQWNTATYQQRKQLRLISLLNYEVGFRKTDQIDAITGLTENITFFKNLHDHELHRRCSQCMKYETFPAGSLIFKIGSIGLKFYIIIEGSVGVYLRPIHDPSGKVVSIVVDPEEKYGNIVGGLQYSKQLSTGESFGELALLERRPRQASIVAHTDLHVGVIEKCDFELILKTHEENKQQQVAKFFDRIPPFSKWNFRRQVSLHLNSTQQGFKINQIVFRQGSQPTAFYIIKSGTFAVIKELKMNKKERKFISYKKKIKEAEKGIEEQEKDIGTIDEEKYDNKIKNKQSNEQDKDKGVHNNFEDEDEDDDEEDGNKIKDIELMKRNTQGLIGIKLSELQEYGYFGDEEITEKISVRQFSVICTSAQAEVLVIQKKDFELRVLSDAISCQFFVQKSELRRKRHNNLLDCSESQLKVFKDYVCQTSSQFCKAELNVQTKPRCMSSQEVVITNTLVKGNYFESEYAKKEQKQRVANDTATEQQQLKSKQMTHWMDKYQKQTLNKQKSFKEQLSQVQQQNDIAVLQKHNTINLNADVNQSVDRIRARTPDGLLVSLQKHYTLDDELIPQQIKEAIQNIIVSRSNSVVSVSHRQRLHSQNSSFQVQSSTESPKNTNNSLDIPQIANPSLSIGGFWLSRPKTSGSRIVGQQQGNNLSNKRSLPGTPIKKKEWISNYTASFQENLRKNLHEKFKDSQYLNAAAIKKHLKQSAISSIPNDKLSQPPPALANKKPVMMAPEMDQKLKIFKRIAIQTLNSCKRNTSGPNIRVNIKDIAEELQRKIKQKRISEIKEKFLEIMNTRKGKGVDDDKNKGDGKTEGVQIEMVKSKFMSVLSGKKDKNKIKEEDGEVVTGEEKIQEQLESVKNLEFLNSQESQFLSTNPDSPWINGLDSVREDSMKINEEGTIDNKKEEEEDDWQIRSNNNSSFDLLSPCLFKNSVSQIINGGYDSSSNNNNNNNNNNESYQSYQNQEDTQYKQSLKPQDISPKSYWHRCRKISQSSMFSPRSSQFRENMQKQQESLLKSRQIITSLHVSNKNKVDSGYYDEILIRRHLENKELFCLLKGGTDIEQIKQKDNEGLKRALLSCASNPFILANNLNGEYDSLKEDQIILKEQKQQQQQYPSFNSKRPATSVSNTQQSRSQSLHSSSSQQQQQQILHNQLNQPQNNRTTLHSRLSSKSPRVPMYKFQVAQIEENMNKKGQHHRKTMSQNNMNNVKHITIHSVFTK